MKSTILSLAGAFLVSASAQALTLSDNAGLTLNLLTNGNITTVTLNGITQPGGTGGGFFLRQPNSSTQVPLTGTLVTNAGQINLTLTNTLQAKVTATLTQGAGFIEVTGVLEDLTGTDRGLWLGFNVPVNTLGWNWGHNLTAANQVISSGAPGYSGDDRLLIPIPAVWTTNGGISLCVPPTDPCVFELSADAGGVRVQMAFGLTPITANFPSKAPFRFRIYSIDGTWGFRDALAKYYDWYPDYYTIEPSVMKRLNHRRDWLTMNYENEGPSANDLASIASPELGQYCAYTKLTARPQGMTGVENLLPTDTQGYLDAIANCNDIMHYGRKVLTNDPSLVEARAAISNCTVYHPDGTWSMQMDPALGTLDIGHNVSPNLFKDAAHTNSPVYADMYLRRPGKLLGFNTNFTFIHWDVTGGRSTIVNYRGDHFDYTAYPLTFDQLGRLCLPTQFSNYELFDAYRLLKPGGMFHEGAGMQDFGVNSGTELVGGQDRVGMHFLSSVMASAWNEGGEKYHALGDYDEYRIFMGRKSYRIACDTIPAMVTLGQTNEALATVKRALATATAFGFANVVADPYFYATNHPLYNPATGSVFYTPAHQALWTNYIPASEAIRLAGWEPVTRAFASSSAVEVQRFGQGHDVYLTIWGPTNLPASVDIDIEAAALGLKPNPAFSELVDNTPLTIVPSARGWKLTVPMATDMTRVIRMSGTNSIPVFTNDPMSRANATIGLAYSGQTLSGAARDADRDPLTYSKVSGPSWLNIATNGVLTGNPASTNAGANSWTVRVTDGFGGTNTATLNIQVVPGNTLYTLTINSGSGSGSFTNRQRVAIAASNAPAGKIFDRWTGDTSYAASIYAPTTSVTMGVQNISLTATFRNPSFALTVNSGIGSGFYTSGRQVAISAYAPAAGKIFQRWIGDTQVVNNVSSKNALVTMSSNAVTLTATYVTPTGISVWDSTGGQTTSSTLPISQVFPITGGNVLVVNLSYKGVNSSYPTGPTNLYWVTGNGTVTQTMTRAVQAGTVSTKAFSSSIYYLWNPILDTGGTISGALPTGYQNQILSAYTLSGVNTNTSPIIGTNVNNSALTNTITGVTGVPVGGFAALCSANIANTAGTGFSASDSGTGTAVNWFVNNMGGIGFYQGYIPDLVATTTNFSCLFAGTAAGGHIVAAVFTPSIILTPSNSAPVFTVKPITRPNASAGVVYSNTLAGSATDVDAGDTLTYSKLSGPVWLSVATNGTLFGTPSAADVGTNVFTVKVTDAAAAFDTATLNIVVQSAYAVWANQYQLVQGPNGNDDGDRLSNLYEFGLGGNPTNSSDVGYPITYGLKFAGGTNWFEYVHPKRSDPNSGLLYYLELTTNLVTPVWTNSGYTVTGSGPLTNGFLSVTNRIETNVKSQQFIRLIIQSQ